MRGTDPRAKCSDKDFLRLVETVGPAATAKQLKCNIRNVYSRRSNLERKIGRQITIPPLSGLRTATTRHNIEHAARLHYDCLNGTVLVGSDAHLWPGPLTPATSARNLLDSRMIQKNPETFRYVRFPQAEEYLSLG